MINSVEYINKLISIDPFILKNISPDIKNYEDILCCAVEKIGDLSGLGIDFDYSVFIPNEVFSNKALLLKILLIDGELLKHASNDLKNDKEIVLTAIKNSYLSLQYASEALKDDKDFVMTAVKKCGLSLKFVSTRLKDDPKVVTEAIKDIRGFFAHRIFAFASTRLKNNEEFILSFFPNFPRVIDGVPRRLLRNRNFILKVFSVYPLSFSFAVRNALKFILKTFKNDKEVMLTIINSNADLLFWCKDLIPYSIRDNYDYMLAAVKKYDLSIKYTSKKLLDNENFILEALKINGFLMAIDPVNTKYKDNKDMVLLSLENNRNVVGTFECISDRLKEDKDVIKKALSKDGRILNDIDDFSKCDKELILTGVSNYGTALKYVPVIFKNNREVVMAAVKERGCALKYASYMLKDDEEIVLTAVKSVKQKGKSFPLRYASDRLKDNVEIVKAAIEHNPKSIKYASERIRNNLSLLN